MARRGLVTRVQALRRVSLAALIPLAIQCGSSGANDRNPGAANGLAGRAGAALIVSGAGGQGGGSPSATGSAGLGPVGGALDNAGGASSNGGRAATSGGSSAGSGVSGGSAGSGIGGSSAGGTAGKAGQGGAAGGLVVAGGPNAGGASGCSEIGGGPITVTTQHLDIGVHDPSMIWDGSRYVLFATDRTLSVRTSTDMRQWTSAGNGFSSVPAWVTTTLGATPPNLWAPDVSFFNCTFHVYYAGSTFGSRNSVIGLVTTPTLDPASPNYHFTDVGLIVRSVAADTANAIDPNVTYDESGAPWLAWGSYGTSGIQLHQLDAATGKLSTTNSTTYSIADRNGSSIEGASIVSHNGFFYLFASFGTCCVGIDSTYTTVVGRAAKITGPYTNKAGALMTDGASELLLAKSGRYIGPGGGTAFRTGMNYLYVYHYYDGNDAGASKLLVRPINWSADNWPVLGEPLFP